MDVRKNGVEWTHYFPHSWSERPENLILEQTTVFFLRLKVARLPTRVLKMYSTFGEVELQGIGHEDFLLWRDGRVEGRGSEPLPHRLKCSLPV